MPSHPTLKIPPSESTAKKNRHNSIAFQLASVIESPPKSQWDAAASLIKENMLSKEIRSEQSCMMLEARVYSAEEGIKNYGEREKHMEQKEHTTRC